MARQICDRAVDGRASSLAESGVRPTSRVFSLAPLLALTLVLGCGKSTPDSQPPTETGASQPETAQAHPWGDGSLRGTVHLKWGAPAPEGSTIQLRVWKGGEVVHEHDMPAAGPGPWEFEFKVDDTSDFKEDAMYGIAVAVVVPEGATWYMGDPRTVQIWQPGVEQSALDLPISPMDPRAAGGGPPK
jgi:hypothetical protein